ncbi:hypothetical protein FHG87_010629 [Trinorchestia longiramus]|nr:hypothetical protein FHG87_010629 [Trinorchestia longiramus]
MESNPNTGKATEAKTRYCKQCRATYSLQLFNIRGCNMEECRFCYSNHESVAIIKNQSRKIQELSRQLELSSQLEFNRQIELLAGKEQRTRYKHAKKQTALPTNRYYLTSPLQQTSLALQETLAKPQNYRQPDHVHWDNLSTTALSQHDYRLGLLKILVGNVQSLLPKMPKLQAIASTLSHDIVAVNETRLDLSGRHLPAEVSIKGYISHNVDKPSHSNRGGGALICIKEKLQPKDYYKQDVHNHIADYASGGQFTELREQAPRVLRPEIPPSIFNVPASCLPSPKPAPRPAKVENQQPRYFLQKDKITSFNAFKPERNLQKQYENLIISRSKERLVCLFMTDNFSECSLFVIFENKPTLCSPLTFSAFKNGISITV